MSDPLVPPPPPDRGRYDTDQLTATAAPKETVCEEANRLTQGERGNAYGPPEQDFRRTAALMTTLFGTRLKDGQQFFAEDVARFMICLKLSRSTWSDKRDNAVDIAGYAACMHRCETGEW